MTKRIFRRLTAVALLAGGATCAVAAPTALKGVTGGLWELSGLPGAKAPVRQCIADPMKLALIEHKGAKCTETVLGEQGSTVRVNYQCGGAGFGQGSIKQITPRALRVELSGISNGAPYGFVVQARRVSDCAKGSERGH